MGNYQNIIAPGKIFKVEYGTYDNYTDVTQKVLDTHVYNRTVYITDDDLIRARLLGDPIYGIVKHIIITDGKLKTLYHSSCRIVYDISHLLV